MASGDVGLFEGGVGKDAEGGDEPIRAPKEGEFSPSMKRCARIKHAAAMILTSKRRHNGVR